MNHEQHLNDPGLVPYPSDMVARYREAGHWRGLTLPQVLDRSAESFGPAPFVSDSSRCLTFEELARSSARCAVWLAERGIGPGMNVVLYLPNSVTWVESYFGLLRAGARPVLVLSSHGRVELTHVARKAEASAIITTGRSVSSTTAASPTRFNRNCRGSKFWIFRWPRILLGAGFRNLILLTCRRSPPRMWLCCNSPEVPPETRN